MKRFGPQLGGVAALLFAVTSCSGGDEPNLTDTVQANYSVPLSAVTFPSTEVGTTSAAMTVTLSPLGFTYDTISSVSIGCPDFITSFVGPAEVYKECIDYGDDNPIPAACFEFEIQKVDIPFQFRPVTAGTKTCTVTVNSSPTAPRTFQLTGVATLTQYDVSVLAPTNGAIPLGQVVVGRTSAEGMVSIKSLGSLPLTINSVTVNGAGFALSSGNPNSHTVAPNAIDSWGVTCSPTTDGDITGTLVISNNSDTTGEQTLTFNLSCAGITSNLLVNPSPVQLPTTRVGAAGSVSTVSLAGAVATSTFVDATITGDGLTITRKPAANTTITQSAVPGGDIDITFAPTIGGDVNGTLTITHDNGLIRQVPVSALATQSTLTVTPSGIIDFNRVCVGETAEELLVALNTGSADFRLDDISVTGTGFSRELVSPTSYPFNVLSTGATSASIRLMATPDEGPQVGTLTISTDIPDEPTRNIELRAVGAPGGVTVEPSAIDFGTVATDAASTLESVFLSNCTLSELTIVSAEIVGPDADSFQWEESSQSQVPASGSTGWNIYMQPSARGPKSATLHIVYTGGSFDIELSGEGSAGNSDVRGTYYACQASRGGGALGGGALLLVAMGLVLRRRRR